MWPYARATTWRLAGSVFATSAPLAGGVTGSSPPERIRTGTLLRTGVAASFGGLPLGQTSQTASALSARDLARTVASAVAMSSFVTRGASSVHVTE